MANNIFKKKEITLDTFNDLNKEMIASFSQGDRISDKLIIRLTNDTGPLDLTDVVQVRIDFRKPDGKLVFQYCNIEDRAQGLISAILTTQTLAAPGKVYAEVTAKYPEGKDAVTRQFTFWVQDAIASDKSIESQNEWSMLERAIVAGDMLAGVDLVAIIQAGELAKGALPKTGGTMTGNITMQTNGAPKEINWNNGANQLGRMVMHPSGLVEWFGKDGTTEKAAWNYSPVTNMFNIVSGTNVVKKAGDTMTGPLKMDRGTSNSTSYINYVTGATSNFFAGLSAVGKYHIYDDVNKVTPFEYDPATQSFNVNTNANIVKKAGDTMSGDLALNRAGANTKKLAFQKDGVESFNMYAFSDTHFGIRDVVGNKNVWEYNTTTGEFNVLSPMRVSGQTTVTGQTTFDAPFTVRGSAAAWDMRPFAAGAYSKGVRHTINTSGNFYAVAPIAEDGTANWANQMALYGTTGVFDVKDLNIRGGTASNVVTKLKDTRVTITLNTGFTVHDSNYGTYADRRGNTVTLRGAVRRGSTATSDIAFTLPVDMRPLMNLPFNLPTNTGEIVRIVVGTDGAVKIGAIDKDVYLVATYVVD